MRAIDAGLVVRRLCGIRDGVASERDAYRALGVTGLRLEFWPFTRDLPGLLIGDAVYLRDRLRPLEVPFVVAHEVGHHVLGHGNGLFTPTRVLDVVRAEKHEDTEANLFAGAFVFGDPRDRDFDERVREATFDGLPGDHALSFYNALAASGIGFARTLARYVADCSFAAECEFGYE